MDIPMVAENDDAATQTQEMNHEDFGIQDATSFRLKRQPTTQHGDDTTTLAGQRRAPQRLTLQRSTCKGVRRTMVIIVACWIYPSILVAYIPVCIRM